MNQIQLTHLFLDKKIDGNLLIPQHSIYVTTDEKGNHYLKNIYTDKTLMTLDKNSWKAVCKRLSGVTI